MGLKKEHLSIFLPFNLMIHTQDGVHELLGITPSIRYEAEPNDGRLVNMDEIKPLLRRLSQITQPITHNGETFIMAERIAPEGHKFVKFDPKIGYGYKRIGQRPGEKIGYLNLDVTKWAYEYFIQLVEHHFDVFSQIDAGNASVKK